MPKLAVNGVEFFYDLTGPEGAPAVVFSNSVGCTLEMWDDVVGEIAGRYRCLRYDTRGHGRSGSADTAITIDDLAADVVAFLDELKIDRVHFVGLSLGSMTGLALASRDSGRLAGLVAMATTAHLPPVDFWLNRAATVRASGPEAVIETIIPRWFTAPFIQRAPKAVDRVRKGFMTIDRAGYARCCEAIGAMDLRSRVGAITAPTLVIAGADDPVTTPAMAEAVRAGIPGAEIVMVANAGHLLCIEQPKAVAAHLLVFLDRHTGEGSMPDDAFRKGLAVRKDVLGADHVDKSLKNAGTFGAPWQDFITRVAWGEIWGDPTLPRKTRSLVTLSMMIALHREEEFKLHLRPALKNGVTVAELGALIRHAAVYAGVPAANGAMRWAREVLGDELQ